jgi:O-antigen ligase
LLDFSYDTDVGSYLVFGLLFFLPFVVFPFGVSYFETPKIFVAQCLIQILFLISFLGKDFRLKNYDIRLLGITGGLFVLSIVNYFLYPSDVAFFGNVFRLQGIYLFWHFLLFAILSSRITLPGMGKVFFLVVLCIQLVLTFLMGQTLNGRFYGTLGEAHSLAAFALLLFPFALFAPIKLPKHQRTISSFVALFLAFVLVLLSGSRSGMIGLFIECFFLLLTFKTSIRNAALVGVLLFVLSHFTPFLTSQERWENRRDVWLTAVTAALEKPVTGWGVGNVEVAFQEVSPDMPNLIKHQYVDSSHNFLLDAFVQGGVVGLGLVLSLIFLSFKRFVIERGKRNLMLLFGLMTVMAFNPVSVTILVAFWWVLGQGFSPPVKQDETQ